MPPQTNSTSLLEVSEIERVVFAHLLQLYTISNTAAGVYHIGTRTTLQHLFTILRLGSPRTRCLCLRILRQVVPLLPPTSVLPALPSWVPLKDLRSKNDPAHLNNLTSALLNVVGSCLLPVTHGDQGNGGSGGSSTALAKKSLKTASSSLLLKRAHTLRYQNSNVGTAGGTGGRGSTGGGGGGDSGDGGGGGGGGSGFTGLVGYGSGDSKCVFMSECVAFLRQMLHSTQQFNIGLTVSEILETNLHSVEQLMAAAATRNNGTTTTTTTSPTLDQHCVLNLRRTAAALSICGAHIEYLRVGGNVCLPGGSIARLVAFNDTDDTACWCTFGESVNARPQSVPLEGLRPVEEVNLQQGVVPMTPQMLNLYRLLAGATVEDEDPRKASSPETKTGTNTDTSPTSPTLPTRGVGDVQYWLSTLKMLAMRSLSHMMLHQPTALLALRGGLMPLLMHNALRDTQLPSYVDLRRLEYR